MPGASFQLGKLITALSAVRANASFKHQSWDDIGGATGVTQGAIVFVMQVKARMVAVYMVGHPV